MLVSWRVLARDPSGEAGGPGIASQDTPVLRAGYLASGPLAPCSAIREKGNEAKLTFTTTATGGQEEQRQGDGEDSLMVKTCA